MVRQRIHGSIADRTRLAHHEMLRKVRRCALALQHMQRGFGRLELCFRARSRDRSGGSGRQGLLSLGICRCQLALRRAQVCVCSGSSIEYGALGQRCTLGLSGFARVDRLVQR
jgi:hypothetical protein